MLTEFYCMPRGSGKTTMLVRRSAQTGATIVVSNYQMVNYIELVARDLDLKMPTPITVTQFVRILSFGGGFDKTQKYLIDELQTVLDAMNVEAATVDRNHVYVW